MKYSRIGFVVLLFASIGIVGCSHDPVSPGTKMYPGVAVEVILPTDTTGTLYAPEPPNFANYNIMVSVRDTLTLQRMHYLPVETTGKIHVGEGNMSDATIVPARTVTDTTMPWGTSQLIRIQLSAADTGQAQVTVKAYSTDNVFLKSTTVNFNIRYIEQPGN